MELYYFYRLDLSHRIHGIQGKTLKKNNASSPIAGVSLVGKLQLFCVEVKVRYNHLLYVYKNISHLQILFYWVGDDAQKNFQQQNIFFLVL